jgi:hypothetical protein
MGRRATRAEIDEIAWNTIKTANVHSTALFHKSGIPPHRNRGFPHRHVRNSQTSMSQAK